MSSIYNIKHIVKRSRLKG